MSDLINLLIGVVLLVLGVKGLVGLWCISGILAVLTLLFASPILPILGLFL